MALNATTQWEAHPDDSDNGGGIKEDASDIPVDDDVGYVLQFGGETAVTGQYEITAIDDDSKRWTVDRLQREKEQSNADI